VTRAEPSTAPGVGQKTKPGAGVAASDVADAYDAEESVTSRAVGAQIEEEEESVTRQAPQLSPAALALAPRATHATRDDTTKRRATPALPADGELGSITAEAPGNLTNMLRVIAADAPGAKPKPLEAADEDALPENRTAVMPGAPMKDAQAGAPPPPSPLGGGHIDTRSSAAKAPRLDPDDPDSGLPIAPPTTASGEREGIGKLVAVDAEVAESARPVRETGSRVPIPYPQAPPSVHDIQFTPKTGPRYGLLVGVVAAVSILVPILLFVWLSSAREEGTAEPALFEQRAVPRADPVRPKGGGKARVGAQPPH
jgi:hypothetical protein